MLNRLSAHGLASALTALVFASAASAGPDVTHQELQDATSYGQGTVPGIYGYAWGSYTCNIGDASLSWLSGGTPALAMNAYRLHNGRLVQIGLGNAKHACCVANGPGCGTCMSAGFGLRPGCRDIYSAGFNGGQTRLGPRSGINPFEGTFATIASGTGDAVWRRVQIHRDQMNATTYPGALYFAEGVYVCAEEDPPEQLNNATHRRMTVANTGTSPTYNWTVASGSATVSGQPAIYAWRAHGNGENTPDNSVSVQFADVPGEGRFFAASKARQVAGGLWQYDYAVFNLNSHRSAGGFGVRIPPGAIVSNVGFSAPSYHSGEVYDNDPWTGVKLGSFVNWSTPQKYDDRPNTSALRWGTMYNFWFTTNVAPASTPGQVNLHLFRPGTPSTIQIGGLTVPNDCLADFNGVDGLGLQDWFDFLAAYFANDVRADFNGVGGISVQDVFDYIGAFFAGCS